MTEIISRREGQRRVVDMELGLWGWNSKYPSSLNYYLNGIATATVFIAGVMLFSLFVDNPEPHLLFPIRVFILLFGFALVGLSLFKFTRIVKGVMKK